MTVVTQCHVKAFRGIGKWISVGLGPAWSTLRVLGQPGQQEPEAGFPTRALRPSSLTVRLAKERKKRGSFLLVIGKVTQHSSAFLNWGRSVKSLQALLLQKTWVWCPASTSGSLELPVTPASWNLACAQWKKAPARPDNLSSFPRKLNYKRRKLTPPSYLRFTDMPVHTMNKM